MLITEDDIKALQANLESNLKSKLEYIANIYTDPEYLDLQINNEEIRVPSIIFNPDKKVDFWAISSYKINDVTKVRTQIEYYDINKPIFPTKTPTHYYLQSSEPSESSEPLNQTQQKYLINSIINSYIKPIYDEDWSESYNNYFNAYGYK